MLRMERTIRRGSRIGEREQLRRMDVWREALDLERSKVDFRMELGEQGESTVITRVSRTGASPVEERDWTASGDGHVLAYWRKFFWDS